MRLERQPERVGGAAWYCDLVDDQAVNIGIALSQFGVLVVEAWGHLLLCPAHLHKWILGAHRPGTSMQQLVGLDMDD